MSKQQVTMVLIILMVVIGFVAAVYQAYRPNTTQIIHGEFSSINSDSENDDFSSNKKDVHPKNEHHRDKNQQESEKEIDFLNPPNNENIYDDLFNSSKNSIYPPNDYLPDKQPHSSRPTDHSSSSPVLSSPDHQGSPPKAQDFTEVYREIEQINATYQVVIQMKTENYSSSEKALIDLNMLKHSLNQISSLTLKGIKNKGYLITVSMNDRADKTSSVNTATQGKTIIFSIECGTSNWSNSLCSHMVSYFPMIISSQTNMNTIYQRFSAFNPSDFIYGRPQNHYVAGNNNDLNQIYFFSLSHQVSVTEDFKQLYTAFMTGSISNQYCNDKIPLYRKILFIKQCVKDYIG